jgi:hypothetical protein
MDPPRPAEEEEEVSNLPPFANVENKQLDKAVRVRAWAWAGACVRACSCARSSRLPPQHLD